MKKIKIFLILIVGVFFASCDSNTYKEISFVANPTYNANIGPVVKSNCTSCHYGGLQFPNLETYDEVKDAALNGNLICRIDQSQACGRVMPQVGPMPQTTIDMFILWQQQGYVN